MSDNHETSDSSDSSDSSQNPRRVYTDEERAVIDVYKSRYLEASSSASRKTIAQVEVFPALFNYWKDRGKIYKKKKTQMKADVSPYFIEINKS